MSPEQLTHQQCMVAYAIALEAECEILRREGIAPEEA